MREKFECQRKPDARENYMTEDVDPKYSDFDLWSAKEAIEAMYEGQLMALEVIKPALGSIAKAAEDAASRLKQGGRLVYVGAGTSGRLAVQDGAELGPTFGWPQERLVYLMAGGMEALTVSSEGAEDHHKDGARAIKDAGIGADDVVFGVAASGKTPFTIGAINEANKRGALTIGIANNRETPLLELADHKILAVTGPELVAGSTRMKAGTVQKVILNMLSTAIMSKLGHIYKGLMVDMVVSNKKLEARAINMVASIADCSKIDAQSALTGANNHIKSACLIALGQTLPIAEDLLKKSCGNLREAINTLKGKA
jgi:N-acetylmuramic acid 6-phosphate etherase